MPGMEDSSLNSAERFERTDEGGAEDVEDGDPLDGLLVSPLVFSGVP